MRRRTTFGTEAPSLETWDSPHLSLRDWGARDGEVIGWARKSCISRNAYLGVSESVDVAAHSLSRESVACCRTDPGIRTDGIDLPAAVFPETAATLALHNVLLS